MNKYLTTFALVIWVTCSIFSQSNEIEWVKTVVENPSSTQNALIPNDIWTDKNGNTATLSSFEQPIMLSNGANIANTDNVQQLLVTRYNNLGHLLWDNTIQGLDGLTPDFFSLQSHITGDQTGNVYVLGSFRTQKVVFSSTLSVNKSCTNCEELFLVKYDINGIPY
jgi:hypothetical protein